MTTRADRERHVAQMLANHRIEGYEPDDADKQLQAAYIDGTATLDDLLAHARQFAAAASYDRWLAQEQRETPKKDGPDFTPGR